MLSGTLPSYLGGALSRLTALRLGDNYFTGAVPTALGAIGANLRVLTLGANLLDSASLPPPLCRFACAAAGSLHGGSGAPFRCPLAHGCDCGGATPGTQRQCEFSACPAANLTAADWADVARTCVSATSKDVCVGCLSTLLRPFFARSITSHPQLIDCLVEYTPAFVGAGADPFALALISSCGGTYGYGSSTSTCPVSLPESAFADAAQEHCVTATPDAACGACIAAIADVFALAGIAVSTTAAGGNTALFETLSLCIDTHLGAIVAAGADATALSLLVSCPENNAAIAVQSVVQLDGVRTATFDARTFVDVVTRVLGTAPASLALQVVSAADSGAARRLLADAVRVRFQIGVPSAAEQARVATALPLSAASGVLLQQLRAAGLPVTAVALLSLSLVGGAAQPPPAPALALPSPQRAPARPGDGAIAGAVIGSVAGAAALAALAALTWRRQRQRAAAAAAAAAKPGTQLVSTLPPVPPPDAFGWPRGSDGAHLTLTDATRTDHTTGSSEKSSSGGSSGAGGASGWRAVASDASEVALGARIGDGAFAVVHSARWRGSVVAVKVWHTVALPPGLFAAAPGAAAQPGAAGPPARRPDVSFLREVALLSSLRHPNILAIYAVVQEPPMLVMELGTSGSLRDLLARSSLPTLGWPARLRIATGCACGVEFLHAQSPPIIHTDLKSANIVLDVALVPKVADFGVSWVAASRDGAARRMTRGTPRYMAPEVARGLAISNSKAIDAYGMGTVLHDLAHVNTDAGAPARLQGVVGGGGGGGGGAGGAASSGGETSGASGPVSSAQVLFQRESSNYVREFAAHVPTQLTQLMREALAIAPDARPTLTAMRERLAAMAEERAAEEPGA